MLLLLLSVWQLIVLTRRFDRLLRDVTICLVGKYTRLQDSYTSVTKALSHAAMASNHKLDLKVSLPLSSNFSCSFLLYSSYTVVYFVYFVFMLIVKQ